MRFGPKTVIAGILTGAALTVAGVGYGAFTKYVPPDKVAIRESKFGGGIDYETVYPGGELYGEGIGVTFHVFPTTWQVLNFNADKWERDLEGKIEGYNAENELEVPSSDGFLNHFDVTISYRIADPRIVIHEIGKGNIYEDFVRTKADPALKEALGKLKAEELYKVELREPQAVAARELLNQKLTPFGIEVGTVSIRGFRYTADYETKISAKVLQSQLQITSQEEAKAEAVHSDVRQIVSQGQALVDIEAARADMEVTRIKSEADLYKIQKAAEGNLLVERAKADGQRLVNDAYKGTGSAELVGLEMAKNAAAIKEIYLRSCQRNGVNPLDLQDMLRKLTGKNTPEGQ